MGKKKDREPSVPGEKTEQPMESFFAEEARRAESQGLLEMILRYPIHGKKTDETARRLLDRFGSLSEVLEAPVSELMRVDGVGEHTAVFLSIIPQLFSLYQTDKMSKEKIIGIEKIWEYSAIKLRGKKNENLLLMCMDDNDVLINSYFISEGDVNSSKVDVRKIMMLLLGVNATRAVIAHNHPRGSCLPSERDLETTVEIAAFLKSTKIKLVDHVIIGEDGSYWAMSNDKKRYGCFLDPKK